MDREKLIEIAKYISETSFQITTRYKANPGTFPFPELQTIVAILFRDEHPDPDLKKEIPIPSLGIFEESARFIATNSQFSTNSKLDEICFHLNRLTRLFNSVIEAKQAKQNTVFYSWQSDLPNSTNRSFIQTALDSAIESISPIRRLRLDQDSRQTAGIPDIPATILSKIDSCLIFVADLSIVAKSNRDQYPNPNVLFELGYALKAVGSTRIITLFNEEYGDLNNLPFDLNFKRQMVYKCSEADQNKAELRRQIEKRLKVGIETIIDAL